MLDLVDEHWIDNLAGVKLDDRIAEQINQRRIAELRQEGHDISDGCFVCSHKLGTKMIKEIGFSKPSDLILDNFVLALAGLIAPVGTSPYFEFTDYTNTPRKMYTCFSQPFNYLGSSPVFQLGSSTTAPARTDYKIGTALGTAPESTFFTAGPATYGGGSITTSASISAGGSGTVNEAGFFGFWYVASTGSYYIMLFHDSVTAVPYTHSTPLTCSWTLSI